MALLPMARIALRNLFTPPATRLFPAVARPPFPATRGRLVIDFPACIHCLACAKHCPAGAIEVDRAARTWAVDRFACVICGACVRACPKRCLAIVPERCHPMLAGTATDCIERHWAAPPRGELPGDGPTEPPAAAKEEMDDA